MTSEFDSIQATARKQGSAFGLLVVFGGQCIIVGMHLAAMIYDRNWYGDDADATERAFGYATLVLSVTIAFLIGRQLVRRADALLTPGPRTGETPS